MFLILKLVQLMPRNFFRKLWSYLIWDQRYCVFFILLYFSFLWLQVKYCILWKMVFSFNIIQGILSLWKWLKMFQQRWKKQLLIEHCPTKFWKFLANFTLWSDTMTKHLTSISWVIFFKVLSVNKVIIIIISGHL